MQDKLEILIKQIKLPDSMLPYFKDGKLERIIGNKNHDSYVFILHIKSNLSLDDYLVFNDLLCKGFPACRKVQVKFEVDVENNSYIEDYYQYFLNKYIEDSPLLAMFKNITFQDDYKTIMIKVSNQAEEKKFLDLKEKMEQDLIKVGYHINFISHLDSEQALALKEEIASSLEVSLKETKAKKKTKPEVILGEEIKSKVVTIDNLIAEENNVTVEVQVFGDIDFFESTRSNFKIITLKITDYVDSIYCKIFVRDDEEYKSLSKKLKSGNWYKIRGYTKNDPYSKELVLNARDINELEKNVEVRTDLAKEKRVELHAHTMMSQMDGVVDEIKLVKKAIEWGHKAIAITDHNGVQAFPHVYNYVRDYNKKLKDGEEPFKALYGVELTLIDDTMRIVVRPNDNNLLEQTYVVFDFETTGFNAAGNDSIIEIGAVKIKNGEIIDRFDELVNPGKKLPKRIVELTHITDDMLKDKDSEEEVVKRFIAWFGDEVMVAHNAKFDTSFLEVAYKKYNLGEYKNTVIDTLELSRALDNNYARHNLSALVKRYDVEWDEDAHHRADYDAEGTALVFYKMLKKLNDMNFEKISDLDKLVSKDEIHKYGRSYHVNLIAKNKVGLKNLFKIVSYANTKYLYKTPRILRSEIERLRDGLLVGSGCYESEVFVEARSKTDEELTNIINFYDYVEVQPPSVYDHLLQMGDFLNRNELIENIKKIIRITKEAGKIIVATGDVHHIEPSDKIYRQIIVNQKVPGGGRHPLNRQEITDIPSYHLRTTDEMLEDFNFLDSDLAYEIVVTNPNKIADMVDIIEVIIETGGVPFAPKIENSVETVIDLVYTKAQAWYGNPLPYNIEERIASELYGDGVFESIKTILKHEKWPDDSFEAESYIRLNKTIKAGVDSVKEVVANSIKLTKPELSLEEVDKLTKDKLVGIIGAGFDVIYLIAQKLVKKSNDDGYLVGSRGSVGSSFVATMMGITEVNPLPAHYRCPKCQHSIFEMDGELLGATYLSGFDLPDMACPKCGTNMIKDGNDMPFATFLGFNADKVPDIDLNFSDLNQADAHEYTKVLFGVDNVYRAGTIGTVAEKTAFGFVKGYCEDKGINMRYAEIERLALGCTGVKRTTGQHPGGIVVIPDYMDVFDFTPYQYPADDPTSAWRTTHFDYHAIDQDVLKLDILGHSDPTQLRLIQDISHMDVSQIPLDDKKTMSIFLGPEPLGVTKEQIMCETGTLGIPEFGTNFTISLVSETKPKTFAELIKISGLSHGTDVWVGNAQELIKNKIVPFKDVIGCRDDIMVYLMYNGLEPIKAFKIMEFVRKGKASKDPETWAGYKETMKKAGIADWFIDSCGKIKYMFPKAHATAYVISAFRIAYFKVHYPAWFYASWFSTKATDFDIEVMIKGYQAIKNRMEEIINKGYDASNKESGILESLRLALEATARGIKIANVDLNNSEAKTFKVDGDILIPPFSTIDGLGDTVAKKIVEERIKAPFLSVEDLQKRAKVSNTIIEKMRMMGILDELNESNQLSLNLF